MSQRNELKIRVLGALESGNWTSAAAISSVAGFRPKRAVYSYLLRLQRWGLVRRWRRIGRRVSFAITDRGRERLAWLTRRGEAESR